eukprot:4509297-Pyramimonas_sp.AAC.1
MLSVSILMYRVEGCAVLRRAERRCARCGSSVPLYPSPDQTGLDLELELPERTVAAPERLPRLGR